MKEVTKGHVERTESWIMPTRVLRDGIGVVQTAQRLQESKKGRHRVKSVAAAA